MNYSKVVALLFVFFCLTGCSEKATEQKPIRFPESEVAKMEIIGDVRYSAGFPKGTDLKIYNGSSWVLTDIMVITTYEKEDGKKISRKYTSTNFGSELVGKKSSIFPTQHVNNTYISFVWFEEHRPLPVGSLNNKFKTEIIYYGYPV